MVDEQGIATEIWRKLDLNHSGAVSTAGDLDLSGLDRDERAVMKELILKAKAAVEARQRAEAANR